MRKRIFLAGLFGLFIILMGIFLSGSRNYAFPGEYQYLGPITWKSSVDETSYVVREDYSRQNTNDVVIQGQISTSKQISQETVLINFASQETGLQMVLVPSNKSEKMKLRLIVRTDLPIDNDCKECIKPRHVVSIGDISPDNEVNTFLIRIRNQPGEYLVEFNGKERRQPKDFSPSEVNLDLSYIEVGSKNLVLGNENVSLEKLTIGFSSDVRQLKLSYIVFSVVLILLAWAIAAFSRPRPSAIESH
jgi:hypothetical protein